MQNEGTARVSAMNNHGFHTNVLLFACFAVQVALGWPLADFASAAKAALATNSVDVNSLQKLAQARNAHLPEGL